MASPTRSLMPLPTSVGNSSSIWTPPANGLIGGYRGDNVNILRAMTAFTAIAWYNVVELLVLILSRFKKYSGLYFWSLTVTSVAILVYQLGSWGNMRSFAEDPVVFVTFQNIGWIFMVTGQSLVLYSRLHIITMNQTLLKFVLWMIIGMSSLMYIPTTTLNYGTVIQQTRPYVDGYNIMEKIQMTLFSVQEIIISLIYLVELRRFTKAWEKGTRRITYELIAVNIALICLDAALLSVEFLSLYMIETTLKGAVYSVKLKLELAVLGRMVNIVQHRSSDRAIDEKDPDDIDLRKYSSAVTHDFLSGPNWSGARKSAEPGDRFEAIDEERDREHAHDAQDAASQQRSASPGRRSSVRPLAPPTHAPAGPNGDDAGMPSARPASAASSLQELYPGRIG